MKRIGEIVSRLLLLIVVLFASIGIIEVISPGAFGALKTRIVSSESVIRAQDMDQFLERFSVQDTTFRDAQIPATPVPATYEQLPSGGVVTDIIPTVQIADPPSAIEVFDTVGFIPLGIEGEVIVQIALFPETTIHNRQYVMPGNEVSFQVPVGSKVSVEVVQIDFATGQCIVARKIGAPVGGVYNVDLSNTPLGACPVLTPVP